MTFQQLFIIIFIIQKRLHDFSFETDLHALLSPLGWLTFRGKTSLSEVPVKVLRANVEDKESKTLSLQQAIDRKDEEVAELCSVVKDLSVEDEILQWSRTDTIASQLVEPCIKIKDDRFEIPVPVVDKTTLPNNFELVHERLSALRKKALQQPDLKIPFNVISTWHSNR